MAKVFEFRPHTKSLSDKISGVIPVNTSVIFRRMEKGHTAYFSSTADLDGFGVIAGVKTIAMVIKPTADTKLLQDNGADKLEITGGDISGTGLTEGTVNTVNTDAVVNNTWSLVIAEFSGGIDFSTDLEIDVTANIDIMNVICYDEILSALQKSKLWDEFNHLNAISTPTIIRPYISVDPTGSVLCHNHQQGNANDLSGNGNDGVPTLIDWGIDGARFNGVNSYIQSSNTGMTDTNYFIELLLKPVDITTDQYVCDQVAGDKRAIRLGYQNNYFNFYDGAYPTGTAADTQILATINEWQYLVMGTDGTSVFGYKNGVKLVEEVGTWTAAGGSAFRMGCSGAGASFSSMSIKFVKVHNSILTEPQIQANWNKIARLVDTQAMDKNLLPDQRVITAGGYIDV